MWDEQIESEEDREEGLLWMEGRGKLRTLNREGATREWDTNRGLRAYVRTRTADKSRGTEGSMYP